MKFSVIGSKVESSLSPLLHSWIYKSLNLDHQYSYIKISDKNVDTIVDKMKECNLNGANITMPFKSKIIRYIDELDELSNKIGAVNCVTITGDFIKGYNTDSFGFQKLLEINKISLADRNLMILGAGGVFRSIAISLQDHSVDFSIFNRTKENLVQVLSDLSMDCNQCFDENDKNINLNIDMIINCLPQGVDYEIILKRLFPNISQLHTIIDINYYPIKTTIESENFINGLDMFIFQAIKSNEIWMNKNILKDVNYSSLKKHILGQIKC